MKWLSPLRRDATHLSHRVLLLLFAVLAPAPVLAFSLQLSGSDRLPTTTVNLGSSYSITAFPSQVGSYQWYVNGIAIPRETQATLTRASAQPSDWGNYVLAVTDSAGLTTYSDPLVVNFAGLHSRVDRSFSVAPSVLLNGTLLLNTPDGGVLIRRQPDSTRPEVYEYLRLRRDGSVDPMFAYSNTLAGAPLAVLLDGGLITSAPPYRVDSTGAAQPLSLPAGFDTTQPISNAAVQPDGKILVSQGAMLARLNLDGTADATFPTNTYESVIAELKVDSEGRILVRCRPYHYIRLTPDGLRDSRFNPPLTVTPEVPTYPYGGAGMSLYPFRGGFYATYSQAGFVVVKLDDNGEWDQSWGHVSHAPGSVAFQYHYAVDPEGRLFEWSTQWDPVEKTVYGWDALQRHTPGLAISDSGFSQPNWDQDFYLGAPVTTTGDRRSFRDVLPQPDGTLLVSGTFASWDGHVTNNIARIHADDRVLIVPGRIEGEKKTPRKGAPYTLRFLPARSISPSEVISYEWLALDGQPLPEDIHSPILQFGELAPANWGRYQVRTTAADGSMLSSIYTITRSSPGVANISGRARTGDGENTPILGVCGSSAMVWELVRALGPTLGSFGVSGFVSQPSLAIYDRDGKLGLTVGTWTGLAPELQKRLADQSVAHGAIPLSPACADAAMPDVPVYAPGPATCHLRDLEPNHQGVGLIEIFPDREVMNFSLRAYTSPGENIAIGGFVLTDPNNLDRTQRVLVRALGSSLRAHGIVHPLENPGIVVYDSTGAMVARNDDWTASANLYDLTTTMAQVSGFPSAETDSALLLDLPPGAYTMHATGGSGVVLLEVFMVR